MTVHHSRNQIFLGIKLAAFFVFLGRGLQHFIADTPYRAFFWDETIFQLEGNDWSYFSNVLFSDQVIEYLAFGIGMWFLTCSTIIIINPKAAQLRKRFYIVLLIGTFLLFIQAFLSSKDHFFQIPLFLEHITQCCSPLFFLYYLSKGWDMKLVLMMKTALSITFISHGIYALGLLPVPVHFMEMTMELMNLDENAARLFLTIAGIMDFLVAIMIFLPKKISQSALIYMTVWALLTTFARLFYPLASTEISLALLGIGLSETIFRFPHFLITIVLLIYNKKQD